MPKPKPHRVRLSDFKAKKRDEGAIIIEADDGTEFRVEPPELWSDDILTMSADRARVVEMATAMLGGEEEYSRFVAAGGSAAVLSAIVADEHGLDVGESAASSSS